MQVVCAQAKQTQIMESISCGFIGPSARWEITKELNEVATVTYWPLDSAPLDVRQHEKGIKNSSVV